jgi:hypothetical protein
MFWFKKKEIVVDTFTYNSTLIDNFPIEQASKYYPKYFKDMPKFVDVKATNDPNIPDSKMTIKTGTIKLCNGLTDLFSNGFIIPAWHEFNIEVTDSGKIVIPSVFQEITTYEVHPRWQYGDNIYKDHTHIKLVSPWLVYETSGVKFTWNRCDWHRSDNSNSFNALSAVIDFKYQNATHVNAFVKNGTITRFDAGDPFVHLIPISESRVKIKNHLISPNEWHTKRVNYQAHNSYKNHRKLNYPKQSKCPFGFGK